MAVNTPLVGAGVAAFFTSASVRLAVGCALGVGFTGAGLGATRSSPARIARCTDFASFIRCTKGCVDLPTIRTPEGRSPTSQA